MSLPVNGRRMRFRRKEVGMSKKAKSGLLAVAMVLTIAIAAAGNIGLVKKVLSGDLVQIGDTFVARLTGIKAPQRSEVLGQEIYDFTKRELEGQTVKLVTWTTDNTAAGIVHDDKGYPLVQIFYGKGAAVNFNEVMLKKGYARVDLKYLPDDLKHYIGLEKEAREKGLGIWKGPSPVPVREEPVSSTTSAPGPVLEGFEGGVERLRQQLRIPGMAAGVIKNGELIWAKGFGYADVEDRIEASIDTPWHIASVTKTFAAVILLQMVEEGKISLDDPLEKYSIRIKSRGIVRVRHILTHTSESKPGTFFRYSGRLWEHLAQVIRESSGETFKERLVERIIDRLELSDTAPNKESASEAYPFEDIRSRAAVFYGVEGASPPQRHDLVLGFYAAGGLFSSVRDMAVYNAAIDNDLLLKPETRRMMFTPHTTPKGRVLPHGLGWFSQDLRGTRLVWHFGWHPDHASALIVKVPAENLSFVIFANSDRLSQPFNLLHGDVLNSPAALLFLKTFVFPGEPLPEITAREALINDIVLKAGGWKPLLNPAQKGFLAVCLSGFLSAPFIWGAGRIFGKRRSGKSGAADQRAGWGLYIGRTYILLFALLCVLFSAALLEAPFLITWPELPGWIDGISPIENIVLALPTLLAVLSLGLLPFTLFVWIRKNRSLAGRLHDTLLAVLGLGFTLLLVRWHLVGLSYYWGYLLR
jgi:CubicO group peptidase (beta-lactamase class C family)/predicted RecA/RadA family phage recombinase